MASKSELLERVASLRELGDNWDGYGTMSPAHAAVSAAEEFLTKWDGPVPSASPIEGGEIELEWESGDMSVLVQFQESGGAIRLHAFDRTRTLVEMEDCAAQAQDRVRAALTSLLAQRKSA